MGTRRCRGWRSRRASTGRRARSEGGSGGARGCRVERRADGGGRDAYDVDGSARVVRDGAFVRAFCCKEHVLAAEALAKRLGKNGRVMSAKEGAAAKPSARLARSA